MEKKQYKNFLAVLIASMILGGCGDSNNQKKITVGTIQAFTIYYNEDGSLNGKIPYEKLDKNNIRIVTLEYNKEQLLPKIMAVSKEEHRPTMGGLV